VRLTSAFNEGARWIARWIFASTHGPIVAAASIMFGFNMFDRALATCERGDA
jgi:hypothetical protein